MTAILLRCDFAEMIAQGWFVPVCPRISQKGLPPFCLHSKRLQTSVRVESRHERRQTIGDKAMEKDGQQRTCAVGSSVRTDSLCNTLKTTVFDSGCLPPSLTISPPSMPPLSHLLPALAPSHSRNGKGARRRLPLVSACFQPLGRRGGPRRCRWRRRSQQASRRRCWRRSPRPLLKAELELNIRVCLFVAHRS